MKRLLAVAIVLVLGAAAFARAFDEMQTLVIRGEADGVHELTERFELTLGFRSGRADRTRTQSAKVTTCRHGVAIGPASISMRCAKSIWPSATISSAMSDRALCRP